MTVHEYGLPDDSPVTCRSRDLLVQEHLWENNTNKETSRFDANLSSETAQKFWSLRVEIVRGEREKHGLNILCETCKPSKPKDHSAVLLSYNKRKFLHFASFWKSESSWNLGMAYIHSNISGKGC